MIDWTQFNFYWSTVLTFLELTLVKSFKSFGHWAQHYMRKTLLLSKPCLFSFSSTLLGFPHLDDIKQTDWKLSEKWMMKKKEIDKCVKGKNSENTIIFSYLGSIYFCPRGFRIYQPLGVPPNRRLPSSPSLPYFYQQRLPKNDKFFSLP